MERGKRHVFVGTHRKREKGLRIVHRIEWEEREEGKRILKSLEGKRSSAWGATICTSLATKKKLKGCFLLYKTGRKA